MADDDAALGEEIIDIPEAEAEPMAEPDGVSADLARVAIACARIRRLHLQIIFAGSAPRQLDNSPLRAGRTTKHTCSVTLLLIDDVDQGGALRKPPRVLLEHRHPAFPDLIRLTGNMGSDDYIFELPQWVALRKRFGIRDV